MWTSALIFVACAFGGAAAGCAWLLVGGLGVERVQNRELVTLRADVERLRADHLREVKRRASLAATESRIDAKSDKELQREAERTLRAIPGLPNQFHG